MTTLLPNSQACSQVEVYEDMFKEITRKLYGEVSESSQSLQTPATHIAPIGPDVERSFINLLSDRNGTLNDFEHGGVVAENVSSLKNDDHLTAFGLALMHNGFPTPNSILNSQTFQQINKQNQTNFVSSSSLGSSTHGPNDASGEMITLKETTQHTNELNVWNSKAENYQHSQKQFKNKKVEISENSMMLHSPNNLLPNESLKSTNSMNGCTSGVPIQQTNASNGQTLQKRYNCSNCPYSTDRRDLFTRHENIHKEDKPFHCYVCLKQFNRADHVKKHFLRMHRGLNYDNGRTKRSLPQQKTKKNNSSGYYNQTNNAHSGVNMSANFHTSLPNQQLEQQQSQSSIIDRTSQHLGNPFHSHAATASNHPNASQPLSVKVEKIVEKTTKKGDKRSFMCCYCSWSGSDNWGLKRHLNTHTKPFVCVLCDYKAARSERLATHVFKVHNKKVCTKCNYLAENQSEYDAHINDAHANETRSRSTPATNSSDMRTAANNISRNINNSFSTSNSFNVMQGSTSAHNWRTMVGDASVSSPSTMKSNVNSNVNQKKGAERLFQYFEADDSDPEDYARQLQMAAISRNTQCVAQDFHNAGGGKTKGIQYAENSMEKLHCYGMNGQKFIRIFLHSIDFNINSNTKNTKNTVPDQRLTMGPSISPPANQKQMSDQSLERSISFDHEHNKENNLVLYEICGKNSFDSMSASYCN
ncbi:protein charlatan [Sitodiplosis mosellana]|uniref:protein charlatan n=1 Tax=Sitodiplosis mosellana TaxID=263140 RepID=UPI002444DBB3|nr:protein charlatan [Sitodiplosis mosellana]